MGFIDYPSKQIFIAAVEGFTNAVMNRLTHMLFGDRASIAEAIAAIQKAAIHTKNFIDNTGYVANTDLSDKWIDAYEKMLEANVGDGLDKFLLEKAKFWGEPEDWIGREEKMMLVPRLDFLLQRCKEIELILK